MLDPSMLDPLLNVYAYVQTTVQCMSYGHSSSVRSQLSPQGIQRHVPLHRRPSGVSPVSAQLPQSSLLPYIATLSSYDSGYPLTSFSYTLAFCGYPLAICGYPLAICGYLLAICGYPLVICGYPLGSPYQAIAYDRERWERRVSILFKNTYLRNTITR